MPNWLMPPLMNNHGNYIVSLGNVCRWLGAAGGGARRRDLSGLRRGGDPLRRQRCGARRGDRRHGRRRATASTSRITSRAWSFTPSTRCSPKAARIAVRRADAQVRPARRRRPAEIRHRHQGALGSGARQAQAGPRDAQPGLAARRTHRRRLVPLSLRRAPRRGRLRRAPQLREPVSLAVRRVPALQDAPRDPADVRRRQAPRLRRPRHHRRRAAIGAEARLPGRRPDRVLGRLREPAAHQGQSQRDEDRDARRRGAFAAVTADRAHDTLTDLDDAWRRSWVYEDLYKVRNVKPGLSGACGSAACTAACTCGSTTSGSARSCRGRCGMPRPDNASLLPASQAPRIEYPKPDGVVTFDKLSSVFLSNTNHEEDQPVHLQLRDPAIPVDVNLAAIRRTGAALLPRRRLRVRRGRKHGTASGSRSTRRIACTARPATSRTRRRTSTGSRRRAAAARTTRACKSWPAKQASRTLCCASFAFREANERRASRQVVVIAASTFPR